MQYIILVKINILDIGILILDVVKHILNIITFYYY